MNRSEFIKTCCLAAGGSIAASLLLESCGSSIYYANATKEGNLLKINSSDFSGNSPRKFVVVKSPELKLPVCLFRFSDTEYSAVLMECTHKGCELNPAGDHLVCPCHGSQFSAKGVVMSAPANKNLRSFPVTIKDEHICIEI